ncbi:MAG TPA: protein translocase subunit SecD [Ilumatobacteraceae bacterium]|nr:protein translocase subunit SecD [Ilumatobacteraceae bacterium]
MRRRLWISMIGVVLIVIATIAFSVGSGNTPILGLDLQGGVSVILAPVEPADESDLIVIRDLIRDELERQGIAEPDVRVQGQTIVVDLPGVRDQAEALSAVDVSGVVELRPVLNFADCPVPEGTTTPTTTTPLNGVDAPTTVPTVPTAPTGSVVEPSGLRRPTAPVDSVPVDSVPVDTVPTDTVPVDAVPTDAPIIAAPTTAGAELLPDREGSVVCVGPAQGTGEVFERGSAELTLDQGFGVAVNLRGDGQGTWNSLASQCYNAEPTCPSTQPGQRGQIAIVLDSVVQSAPQVNQPNFTDSVAITGDFSRDEASELAAVLNRGAFPVEVVAQEARTVSASAGSDALQAAIIAGLIGVLFVLILLVAYYRSLAIVIVGGIIVWAGMVYAMAALVSGWTNYALSLAGVTGIIVAIGVTVDSYVVFFERIKDELRSGRTIKNAAPRSFKMTWRTIWSADVVSLIGALVLFSLSVGSVRGFALYLGLTTICDLLVCYFFTRPAVLLLAGTRRLAKQEKLLGMNVATA